MVWASNNLEGIWVKGIFVKRSSLGSSINHSKASSSVSIVGIRFLELWICCVTPFAAVVAKATVLTNCPGFFIKPIGMHLWKPKILFIDHTHLVGDFLNGFQEQPFLPQVGTLMDSTKPEVLLTP